jgi:hypothetical protein
VRPVRIELTTLGLGVPCSIQFELRARTLIPLIPSGFSPRSPAFENRPLALAVQFRCSGNAPNAFSRPFTGDRFHQPHAAPVLLRWHPDPRDGLLLRSGNHVAVDPQRYGWVRVPQQSGDRPNVVSGYQGLRRSKVAARMQADALGLNPDFGSERGERLGYRV